MHSSRLGIDLQVFPQHALQACCRRFPTLGIELPHALDMTREVPFRDEGGEYRLRKRWTAACKGLSDLLKPLDLRLRHDQ